MKRICQIVSSRKMISPLTTQLYIQSSNRKSLEQRSYYESRQTTLNNHQYPHFKPTISVVDFHKKYGKLGQQQQKGQECEQIAGRVSSIRKHGKTTFIDVREEHNKLQIALKTERELQIKRGDIVGVKGMPFVTKKGQLSVNCEKYEDIMILAPCMWMLPEYESLKDQQTRYRNKCLDLISNHQSMQIVKKRARIMSSLRRQLEKQGYMEVETPSLSASCGGALAKPFKTFHNDHKMDLFLRIAPELYLKKLLVGGINRVYQIGKNFRNQSIDQTHNPQFTSCQLYCAYENYQGMIKFTKQLLVQIALDTNASTKIITSDPATTIDISQEWKQIDFMEGLEQALNMKLPIDFQNQQTVKFYDQLCIKNEIPCEAPRSIQRLLDKLAGRYLETSIQPFIIKNHPRVMSPLAKPIPNQPHLTQRFQLFINGWEIVNSYTQLNDPRVQRENTPHEDDFIEALEYGLVPCAGWGIGLDRLVMLLTNTERIQQVISFPLLKDSVDTL